MTAVSLGQAARLRALTTDLAREVERMDKVVAHRELWLEKANNDDVLNAYTRTIDIFADRAAAKICTLKEELYAMCGGDL